MTLFGGLGRLVRAVRWTIVLSAALAAGGCSGKEPSITCFMGQTDCGGVCCPVGSCMGGVCAAACPAPMVSCNGACVDPTSDERNCGTCGMACAVGQECMANACQCQGGLTNCPGAGCVDVMNAGTNCGTCGTICPPTAPFCAAGVCSATCAAGLSPCGTDCADILNSAMHCGGCNRPCPAGQSCASGQCVCPGGQANCGGACTNPLVDPNNCGNCGIVCGAGQACTNGVCSGGGVGGSGGAATGGVSGMTTGGVAAGGVTSGGVTSGGVTSGGVSTGGTSGTPTGGVTSGGATSGGTGGGEEPVIDCSAVGGSGLPLNASGWLDASCNSFGLQGAYYCFDDEVQTTDCVDGVPPFHDTGMCLSGTSVVDPDYASWGGGLGLSLNETGGDASVKTAYNATANGVEGFRVTLTGDSLGRSVRVGFSTLLDPGDNLSPFVEVGAVEPGTPLVADVIITDAVVPEAWETIPNAGEIANPEAIYDLQVQYPGGDVAGNYSVCITKIEPITTGEIPVVDCSLSGAQSAGSTSDQYGQINVGSYMIQNNVWNSSANGHQSISAYTVSGGVGFVVHADSGYNVLSDPNLRPGGYGSAVYGWHMDNQFHGGFTSARAMNSITSARSRWEYCTPAAGNWDAAYDIWIAPSGSQPSASNGTELMIWTATRDATPIGTEQSQTVTLAGAQWEVWVGQGQAGPWQTISFRRITNTRVVDIDIKEFMVAGDPFANYDMTHQLWGIQAGYEIWSTAGQNLNFTTALFSASVQ